jgi:hypothetical protein
VALAIRDQVRSITYRIPTEELDRLEPVNAAETSADIVFVIPSESLVQRTSNYAVSSPDPTTKATESVMILDSDTDRAWSFSVADLQRFITPSGATGADDVWFAIPDGESLISATPLLRRALVQYSC